MAIKVEAYGTKQKKTCFGCGSMISFENDDIKKVNEGNVCSTYIECPVCGKKIKAYPVNREQSNPKFVKETEFGRKVKQASAGCIPKEGCEYDPDIWD